MTKVHNPGLSENFEEFHTPIVPGESHFATAESIWLGNSATETFVPHLWRGLVRTIYFQEIDGHPSVRIRYVYVLCIPYVFIHNHPEVDRISNIFVTEDFLKYPYSIYSRMTVYWGYPSHVSAPPSNSDHDHQGGLPSAWLLLSHGRV